MIKFLSVVPVADRTLFYVQKPPGHLRPGGVVYFF